MPRRSRRSRFQHRKAAQRRIREQKVEDAPVTLPNKNWSCQELSGRTVYFRMDLNVLEKPKPICTPEPPAHVSATHTVTVFDNGSWTVHFYRNQVDRTKSNVLNTLPANISSRQVTELLSKLDKKGSICAGHPDNHFIEMIKAKKGKLLTVGGEIGSYLDDNPVEMNGQQYSQTIRTIDCSIVENGRCEACTRYRANLRSMYSQWKKAGKKASTNLIVTIDI